MFLNISKVLKGKVTWVSYSKDFGLRNELPILKTGILSPIDRFKNENLEKEIERKINIQYAKEYQTLNDFKTLLKGLKRIDE